MKNIKRIFTLILALSLVVTLAACSKKDADNEGGNTSTSNETSVSVSTEVSTETSTENSAETEATMGTQLKNIFDKEMAGCNDVMKMAAMLANPDICQMAVDVVSFNEGYLPGFDADVTGFKSCAGAVPMISTIPFVAYVFEADNPESFLETIKGLANPRWNICTEAAETVYSISGNFVFLAMCPGGEDW